MRKSKLSIDQWQELISLYQDGVSTQTLSESFNVSIPYIYQMIRSLRKKGVQVAAPVRSSGGLVKSLAERLK